MNMKRHHLPRPRMALWLLLVLSAAALSDRGQNEVPAQPETPPEAGSNVKVVLQRDRSGNYMGEGTINHRDVHFLVDTGASMVIVPEAIAKRIGLKKGKPMTFRTGGGVVTHYETELDTLSIGRIQIRQAPAAINPQMKEDFVLLGMSALGLLRFTQEGDNLVLSYDGAADTGAPAAPENVRFRRSVKDCMGESKVFNQKTLECLKGN